MEKRFVSEAELLSINERFITNCAKCKREGLKRNMATLYIKENSYSPSKKLCHICPMCLPLLLDDLEVSL